MLTSAPHPPVKLPTYADVEAAARNITGLAVHTPLLRSDALDRITGARVFLKAENLQRGGAFKYRGATHRLAKLGADERLRGVVAFSSGNHAIAVASAARLLGIRATILMPQDAPSPKIEETRAQGATIHFFDRLRDDRDAMAASLAAQNGAIIVPPFEDADIIAGQGTCAREALQDLAVLGLSPDLILVCAGGCGLLAGSALSAQQLAPQARIWGVEPAGHNDLERSLLAGRRLRNAPGQRSFCDGLLAPSPGLIAFSVLQKLRAEHIDIHALSLSDDWVERAMVVAFSTLKIVLEPSGAISLAALLANRAPWQGLNVLVIATGGNVEPKLFGDILSRQFSLPSAPGPM